MTNPPSGMKDLHDRNDTLPLKPFSRVPIAKTCLSSSILPTASGAPKQDFRFVARQPILNREQQVFGIQTFVSRWYRESLPCLRPGGRGAPYPRQHAADGI